MFILDKASTNNVASNDLRSPTFSGFGNENRNLKSASKSTLWSRAAAQDHDLTSPTPAYGLPINDTPYPSSAVSNTTQRHSDRNLFSPVSANNTNNTLNIPKTPLTSGGIQSNFMSRNTNIGSNALINTSESSSSSSLPRQSQFSSQTHLTRYDDNCLPRGLINTVCLLY